ncbi:MAG: alpha/beta fold hydrolase [Roseiflexaceae bacterium]|nr:alpha/beta fold hydrolase [Roseiflexaceae bacterium]
MNMPEYPVDAPRLTYMWHGHRIAYYTDGDGPTVLLIHSINAAASSFEMRQTLAGLRTKHRVYALDFLGYGGSDRPARRYSADDYAILIADFTREVIGVGTRVIASSLSSAYVIRAAARNPGLFGALILVCPTGIVDLAQPKQPGAAYALLYSAIGDALFAGLTSRGSIRYFLSSQSYYDPKAVDDALVDGFCRAANQPGRKYAPICFLTGLLNCNIAEEFGQLQQPILLVWGKNADITPLERAQAFLERNPRARLEVFDRARLSIQDEHPAQFNRLALEFFAST